MGDEGPGYRPIGGLIASGVTRRLDAIDAERRAVPCGPVIDARLALAPDMGDAVALRARLVALVEAVFGAPVGGMAVWG